MIHIYRVEHHANIKCGWQTERVDCQARRKWIVMTSDKSTYMRVYSCDAHLSAYANYFMPRESE